MANRIDGGSSSWWNWCCCCCENDEKDIGTEREKLSSTKQEKLLDGAPGQQRMGCDTEQGNGSRKRTNSPGASYGHYQTGHGVGDSPMK